VRCGGGADETHQATDYILRLERNAKESIVPFWLRKTMDTANGGFYCRGAFHQPAHDRHKSWWVQAEAVASAPHAPL
jgi:mannose/cellobiose epimerase-like protein (N-acyl-D-glucosamine 2-epimerase family)